jgi:dynein heavy chain
VKSSEGRSLIYFAEQDLDYSPSFRLYLTTKKPNPSFLPEIFIKVNVINFTVTFDGLEDQLLAEVVKREKPAIEIARDENIVNLSTYRKKILESENLILKLLSEAKNETLLDDVDLINTLQTSKLAAMEVEIQIKNSVELEKNIEETRNVYRGVATRGSVLFFVIKDLEMVDNMYQYSLQYIAKLFNISVENAKSSTKQEERLRNLIDTITKTIFTNICRGLFEQHKLLFSFMIAASIEKQNKSLNPAMWNVFLRGAGLFDNKSQPKCPEGLLQTTWDLAYYLEINFKEFEGLTDNLSNQYPMWKEIIQV